MHACIHHYHSSFVEKTGPTAGGKDLHRCAVSAIRADPELTKRTLSAAAIVVAPPLMKRVLQRTTLCSEGLFWLMDVSGFTIVPIAELVRDEQKYRIGG